MVRLFTIALSFLAANAMAAAHITYLDINEGTVVFSTDEAKSASSPACMASANADKWAVSLSTDDGRAIYTLLMTAMATQMTVDVQSAGDCADKAGYERPVRVWTLPTVTAATTMATETVLKPVAFGRYENDWQGNANCSIQKTLQSSASQPYMVRTQLNNNRSRCDCGENSTKVFVSLGEYSSHGAIQCVIEVEVPVVS